METIFLAGLALVLGAMAMSGITEAQKNRRRRKHETERRLRREQQELERQRLIAEAAEKLAAERLLLRGTGKVPVVDWDQAFFESHSIRFRRPSVPRARPSGWSSEWDERQLLRQEGCCFWCGESLNGVAHRDHIEPLARGGRNDVSNLVMACPPCNLDKSASDPRDWVRTTSRIADSRREVLARLIPGLATVAPIHGASRDAADVPTSDPVEFDIVELDLRLFGD